MRHTFIARGDWVDDEIIVWRDMVDVTIGAGLFGGTPDMWRKFAPGPWRYAINGTEVDRATYVEAVERSGLPVVVPGLEEAK